MRYGTEWSPAVPEHPKISVNGKPYTIRSVCVLALGDRHKLPDKIVAYLFQNMRVEHDWLREKLGQEPSYTIGAECLIRLMDARKAAHRKIKTTGIV